MKQMSKIERMNFGARLVAIVTMALSPLVGEANCTASEYEVHYLPLAAQFYVPPTRDDILKHGVRFEMSSPALQSIFSMISKRKGSEPKKDDLNRLRILVVSCRENKELLITSEKKIISGNKVFRIRQNFVNVVLAQMKKLAANMDEEKE